MQELYLANNQNFPHSTIHDINRWVRSFDFSTKTNFTTYKLEGIKALRNVKIKWDFFHAAVKFWGTEDHVFRFKTAELCPTIEEFLAILGYDLSKKSVADSCDPRHREILSSALGLSTSITSSMIEGHMVNLHAVVSRLINKRTHGVTDNMQKNFGLVLCYLGEFLLCSGRPGFMDARAIGIVSQVKYGDDLASLILAKFLGGESQNFLRSPLTLQIWLMERLDMVATPTVADYGLGNFLSKAILKTKCQTKSIWVKFLNKKSSVSIQWNCYWWKCPPTLLRSPRSNHIFVVGLRKATLYKADILLGQFQYEKGMPGGKGRKPFTPMDTNPTSIRNMLLGLEMADPVDQSFVKVHFHKMTTEYSNWLVNKIAVKEADMVAMRKQFFRDN